MQANRAVKRGPGQAQRPAISTAKEADALRQEAKEFAVRDAKTEGLWLVVKPSGTKSWVLFYSFAGKQRKLTIGQVGLAEARVEAAKARVHLAEKMDPAQAKRLLNEATRKPKPLPRAMKRPADAPADPAATIPPAPFSGPIDTFANVIALYAESYLKPRKRRWHESECMLRQKGLAKLHDKRLSELTADDFNAVLAPLWRRAPISTLRLHSEISTMCLWACGLKRRKTLKPGERAFKDPPAELKALLNGRNAFAGVAKQVAESEARERVLMIADADDTADDSEVFGDLHLVWQASDAMGFPYGPLVKLLILTGQRLGEVAKMHWGEVDLDARVWRLPGTRTKNKRAHSIPLPPAAITLLEGLPRFARKAGEVDFVFGLTPPTAISSTKKKLDKELARVNGGKPIAPFVLHDLRRTLVSGLARLQIDLPVIERVVNHSSGTFSGIVGTYQKHKFESEKRAALNKWADLIKSLAAQDHIREREYA